MDTTGTATQVENGPSDPARRIDDPRGVATTFETDRSGNTTAVVSRDTGGLRHSYTYSAFGQVLQHTDPRGLATTYNYDTLGRTTRRVDPQGTSLWTYDTGVNAIGKLVEARSAAVDFTRLSYEPVPASGPNRGQLASTEQTVNGTSYKFGYTYDAFGRTRRVDYPAARNETFSVSYGYDANGLLTTVRNADSDSLFWTFVSHDQGYRIGAERLGNNVTTTSTFQPLSGRPATTTAAASATTVQQLEYGYDAIGNLKHLRDTVRPDRSRSYVHDTVNRLTSARLLLNNNPATPGSVVESFAYNAGGNLTSKGDVGTYTYRPATDVHPNAVFGAGTNSYTYDAAGNQVNRTGPGVASGTQTITWTPRNLPASISVGTGSSQTTTTFRYNAADQRVSRSAPDATTTYIAGLYERRQPTNGGAVEHRYYIPAGEETVAQLVKTETPTGGTIKTLTYEHPDRLGSPVNHSSEFGAAGHSQRFGAYGTNLDPNWRTTGERGFAGHDHDADLGLIDMEGRLYDPTLGRFLSVDPTIFSVTAGAAPADALIARAAEAGSPTGGGAPALSAADLLQPYAYAANSPLAYVDPNGRDPSTFYRAKAAVERLAESVRTSTLGHAVLGYTMGVAQGAAPGGFLAGPAMSYAAPSQTFEFFRGAGEAVYGLCQCIAGGAGTAGGGALMTSGVGAPIGAAAVAVSA
ncbi:hypothetical protein K1W54_16770, partial [Micromonospora sp. CPCC 205371]|nr:hypothetical protein [Micromonospora sp. CPCC 205371]